jgi:hypothetical protein
MYATDFEYDGMRLSDYGMMICSFDKGGGLETISSGANLSFETVKSARADNFRLINSKYEESYSMTFQICKNNCLDDDKKISPMEVSAIQRWLCRKDNFHRFKVLQEGYEGIHWNATFSSKQIEVAGQIVGLELTLTTDSPYAYGEEQSITFGTGTSSLYDLNDEIGYMYPTVTIKNLEEKGTLEIINISSMCPTETTTVTFDGFDIITINGKNKTISSVNGYDLSGKFNFVFPKLMNTFDERKNLYVIQSLNCEVTFSYCPKIKVGL